MLKPRISKVDDFFELDAYQIVVLIFNELLIYTSLANIVFNMFGAAQPRLLGCDTTTYNGTRAEVCQQYNMHEQCEKPIMKYEFTSTSVEFEQLCSRHEFTWLDSLFKPFAIVNKPKFRKKINEIPPLNGNPSSFIRETDVKFRVNQTLVCMMPQYTRNTTAQMVGIIIGSAITGQLSDIYGRKRVTLFVLMSTFILSLLSSYALSIEIYIFYRFFIGCACGGLTTVSTILIVEMLPAAHRLWLSTIITWAPNYIVFAFVAWLTADWRILARVGSFITLLAVIMCALLIPESPKFLIQKRKEKEAIKALKYINSFKSKAYKVSENDIILIVETACEQEILKQQKSKHYSFHHLYATKKLTIRTAVASFSMFVLSYITYGLIFNLDIIRGSIFMNTAFSGFLRWLIGAAVAVLDHAGGASVGRKRMHFATMGIIMLCLAATFIIKINDLHGPIYSNLVRSFTLIAFGFTGCVFLQYLLVTSELFPTGIRNLANAHVNVCGRLGNVFGPMAFTLGGSIKGFPYLLMSIFALVNVLLFQLLIPETKGASLPTEMPSRKKKPSALEEPLVSNTKE